jgi:hypothetical protein
MQGLTNISLLQCTFSTRFNEIWSKYLYYSMHKFSCKNIKILYVNPQVSAKMDVAIFNTFEKWIIPQKK